MRLGWFAQNLCNKCEQKKSARARLLQLLRSAQRKNNNFSDINIVCALGAHYYTRFVWNHHAVIPMETHINLSGSYNDTHAHKFSQNIFISCSQSEDTIFVRKTSWEIVGEKIHG